MNVTRSARSRSGLGPAASAATLFLSLLAAACGDDGSPPDRPDGGPVPDGGDPFICLSADTVDCRGDVYWFCESDGGEFPRSRSIDCRLEEQICITEPRVGCAICQPGLPGCDEQGRPAVCNEDGTGWIPNDECDASVGEACRNGACENLCEVALEERSYLGCEFYTVDLDNAVVDSGNAAAQQYAIVVSNPGDVPVQVTIERNLALPGEPKNIETVVENWEIAPGDLETFDEGFGIVPFEVDGSSTFTRCDPSAEGACGTGEECLCNVDPAGETSGCRCIVDTSSRKPCVANDPFGCPNEEACRRQPDLEFACVRSGANDGTHTALTSRAYRVRSSLPVVAYQFNPLDNVGVFSNDASLLLPTSAIGEEYTVVAWPQTLSSNSGLDSPCDDSFDCNTANGEFCDPRQGLCRFGTSDGREVNFFADLRSSLTVVGVEDETEVEVTLGPNVGQVVAGGPLDCLRQPGTGCGQICTDAFDCPGGFFCAPNASGEGTCQRRFVTPDSTLSFTFGLDAFDVLNLETDVLNGDFTGTRVRTTDGKPVAVFAGSEASDAPRFDSYATRRCCADHLEEQLIPDRAIGDSYIIARMPPRTESLNRAFITDDRVAEVDEPEYVKVLAVSEGTTRIDTSLPAAGGAGSLTFSLQQGESRILTVPPPSGMGTGYVPGRFDGFLLDADQPVAVLQALPSQQAVGIPNQFPGGDPAILVVPPKDQYRTEYVFLTPDLYAFDYVVITGPADAVVLLDGDPLDASRCTTSSADGRLRDPSMGDPPPLEVIRRCQLGFPEVVGGDTPNQTEVLEGEQQDGVHRIVSTEPVGVVVYGFDAFVSYAYAGGYDVTILQ